MSFELKHPILAGKGNDQQASLRLLDSIIRLHSLLVENVEEIFLFNQVLEELIQLTDSEYGFIGEILYTQNHEPYLKTQAISNISWNRKTQEFYEENAPKGLEFANLNTLFGYVIKEGKPLITNDPSHHPHKGGLPVGHPPLNTLLCLPAYYHDQMIAMVGIANRPGGYSQEIADWLHPFLLTYSHIVHAHRIDQSRKASQLEVISTQARLEGIIDSALECIITIDKKGIVQNFNRSAQQTFGYRYDQVVGSNVRMLMPTEFSDEHEQYLENYHQTGIARTIGTGRETQGRRSDGTLFPIRLAVNEFDIEGKPFYVGTIRDLTRQKAHEEALRKSKEEAEKANRAISKFVSSMSHEIRTPLNAILGFGQLLQMDHHANSNKKQAHLVDQILNSGRHLLGLINDIFDLSLIEAGDVKITRQHLFPSTIFRECLEMVRSRAEARSVTLSGKRQSEIGVAVDPQRFKQVVINLLTNAIKYNKEGGFVEFGCIDAPDDAPDKDTPNKKVRIYVSDTGHGIPEDKKENVFTPFDRLGAENSNIEGTGIGLALSKRLVELMDGKIWFESVSGEGTTFWLEFPAVTAYQLETGKLPGETSGVKPLSTEREIHILYIEDNYTNIELMKAVCECQPRVKLKTVTTANAGLDEAKASVFDIILLDLHLPDMNGVDALPLLKEINPDVPVIALSAAAMSQEIAKGKELGFSFYITKPFDIPHFWRTIFDLVNTQKRSSISS